MKKNHHKEAIIKQSYEPGIACEFDLGEVKLNIGETGYKSYQMDVFATSFCNYHFAKFYRAQGTASFEDSHVSLFSFIHGVFHTFVYDNMKVAVKKICGAE